jgi:hypothetical protein
MIFTTEMAEPQPVTGSDILDEELAQIARTPGRVLARRRNRIAFTIRPHRRGGDALPQRLVRVDAFEAFCLSCRRIDGGRGSAQTRPLLAIYRALADTSGGAPLRLVCVRVFDLGFRQGRGALDARREPEMARTAILLDQALADSDDTDLAGGLRLPVVYFAYKPRSALALAEKAESGHALPAGEPVGDLLAWPVESILAASETRAPVPAAVLVCLAGLAGRAIRNPAFPVLQDHGLIEPGLGYDTWLNSLLVGPAGGRAVGDPRDESTPAGQFRARLTGHVMSDPRRERMLLRDLRTRAEALGLSPPPGVGGLDFHAQLLDSPWQPLLMPAAAAVQVIALAGEPSPETLRFAHPTAEADLYDLGAAPGRRRRRCRVACPGTVWPRVANYR